MIDYEKAFKHATRFEVCDDVVAVRDALGWRVMSFAPNNRIASCAEYETGEQAYAAACELAKGRL